MSIERDRRLLTKPLTEAEERLLRKLLFSEPPPFTVEARQWMFGLLAALDAERAAADRAAAKTLDEAMG